MNVALLHDDEPFVKDRVKSGSYASPGEVVRAGLRALESREPDFARGVPDLPGKRVEASRSKLIPCSKDLLDPIRAKARKADAA